jgi:hypothetical protein
MDFRVQPASHRHPWATTGNVASADSHSTPSKPGQPHSFLERAASIVEDSILSRNGPSLHWSHQISNRLLCWQIKIPHAVRKKRDKGEAPELLSKFCLLISKKVRVTDYGLCRILCQKSSDVKMRESD